MIYSDEVLSGEALLAKVEPPAAQPAAAAAGADAAFVISTGGVQGPPSTD
jgi:hypothetical protein